MELPLRAGSSPALELPLLGVDLERELLVLEALADRGPERVYVPLDPWVRAGRDAVGGRGVPCLGLRLTTVEQWETLTRAAGRAGAALFVYAGGLGAPVQALLDAASEQPGIHRAVVDPYASLAADGELPTALEAAERATVAQLLREEAPGPAEPLWSWHTETWHLAGACLARRLALALASTVAALRAGERHGATAAMVLRRVETRWAIGRDVFAEAAAMRALRLLHARLAELCGVSGIAARARIIGAPSWRTRTRHDRWTNQLRATGDLAAAFLGGADVLSAPAPDLAAGGRSVDAARVGFQSALILREESHLGHFQDALAGSWAVESLTTALCERAWELFQEIERTGGLGVALQQGRLFEAIAADRAEEEGALARGVREIVGSTVFAWPDEGPVEDAVDPAEAAQRCAEQVQRWQDAHQEAQSWRWDDDGVLPDIAVLRGQAGAGATLTTLQMAYGATGSPSPTLDPLPQAREASRIEALRARSAALAARSPSSALVTSLLVGDPLALKARAAFSRGWLEAAGLRVDERVVTWEDAAAGLTLSGAASVVVNAPDAEYETRLPALTRALLQRGARAVVVAGRPGALEPVYHGAGVLGWLALRQPCIETLETLVAVLEAET